MDDPVADVLAQRARIGSGAAAAVAVSLLAHAMLSALAIWAAWHHTEPQAPVVMNIRFAKPAAVPVAAAPLIAKPTPAPVVSKPVEAPKPVAKPVLPSPFGKSTKKATPPAPVPAAPAAPATTSQPEIAVGGTGVTALEGGDFPYTVYIDRMKNLIGSRWLRPQVANVTTATVHFTIDRDGSIRDATVEMASGNGTFDRAALRAVLESSPLPPLPFGYSGTYLGVHLTFR